MDTLVVENRAEIKNASGWNALFAAHGLETLTVNENGTFSFTLDAGAERALAVEGAFTPDASPRYTLTRHELVNQAAETEYTLDLLIQ